MFRYLTAGESHGPALVGILDGLPAKLRLDFDAVDAALRARQGGYGRGGRMKIERDEVEVLAGVRGGLTLGSPIAIVVRNKDYENNRALMDPRTGAGISLPARHGLGRGLWNRAQKVRCVIHSTHSQITEHGRKPLRRLPVPFSPRNSTRRSPVLAKRLGLFERR